MIQREMLDFQTLDGELNRIEKELRKNEFFIKRKQYKALKQECEDKLIKMESKAGELKNQLAQTTQNLAKINAVIEDYTKEIDCIQDDDELSYMTKKLAEQTELLSAVERDVKRILRDGEEIARLFDELNAKLPKIVAGYNKCNEEFNKAAAEVKPKVNEIKTKQAALKMAIDPELFEKYQKISDGQVYPVFVPLLDECRCGGCRMEMPKAVIEAQMRGKNYMRCEHCGRIIYKS